MRFTQAFIVIFAILFCNKGVAEVKETLTTTYFDVKGRNVSSLIENLKTTGPKFEDRSVWAILKWDLKVEFSFKSNQEGCQLVVKEVEVLADISIPSWQDSQKRNRKIKNWWNDFIIFIKEHENKHYKNVFHQASVLQKNISNGKSFESCQLARINYLEQKIRTIDIIRKNDIEIDVEALRLYSSNSALFEPIRSVNGGLVIESGFMKSFIGM